MPASAARPAIPRDHHAVVWVARPNDHIARSLIDLRSLRRIVERRIEENLVAPKRFVGNIHRLPDAIVHRQPLIHFPGVLREPLIEETAEDRVRARTDFGIAVGQAKRGIRHTDARGRAEASSSIGEDEVAVLVVAAAGNARHVDLVAVVFTGSFKVKTGLERVRPPHLRHRIADGVDWTRRVRRIWPGAEAVDVRNGDRGNLPRYIFARRENKGVVDSERAAIESGSRSIDRNVDVIETYRRARF